MTQRKAMTLLSSFLLGGVMLALPLVSSAHTYNRNSTDGHVIRLIAYVVHPIGIVLEYGVTRPVHWLASQPNLDILLGHQPGLDDTYFEWAHGDGTPTISKKRQLADQAKAVPEEAPVVAPPPSEVQQPEQAPAPLVIELQEQPEQQTPPPAEEKPAPAPQ